MEVKTINEIQDEIIEELEPLEDWMDRYQVIIEYGKDIETPQENQKRTNILSKGVKAEYGSLHRKKAEDYFSKQIVMLSS